MPSAFELPPEWNNPWRWAAGARLANARSSWPRVTIVTPSYNQAEFIEATIRSVALQNYPNLEYFVVDGGSTDGTLEVLRRYDGVIDWWVSEPDRGQADAINKGWRRATGDYLWWLNSDDFLLPGALCMAVNALEDRPAAALVFGDLVYIDEHGMIRGAEMYRDVDFRAVVEQARWISQPGGLMRRSSFERAGYLDTTLHFQMDRDYWYRLGLTGDLQYLPRPLAAFRIHSKSKTNSIAKVAARDMLAITESFFSRPDLPPQVRGWQWHARAEALRYAAFAWYGGGDARRSLSQLLAAIARKPSLFLRSDVRSLLVRATIFALAGAKTQLVLRRLKARPRFARSSHARTS